MHLSTILSAAILAASSAEAALGVLRIPSTIKNGATFNMTGELYISQPRNKYMVVGIATKFYGNNPPAGTVGTHGIGEFDLGSMSTPKNT